MLKLLGQIVPQPTGGEGDAFGIVNGSIDLAKKTSVSWDQSWETLFDTQQSGLWYGLVKLGIALAAISILYLTMTSGKEIIDRQSWSELAAMFAWPLVIMLFLGQTGNLLAKTVLMSRAFGTHIVTGVLEVQLGEIQFKKAIGDVAITGTYRTQIEDLYRECQPKVGEELINCWKSKQPVAEQIVKNAEQTAGGPLKGLQDFAKSLVDIGLGLGQGPVGGPVGGGVGTGVQLLLDPGSVFRSTAIPIIRFVLYALQWAFVNMLEAALLMTALFSPVAMGLSLLPLQGRPIWAWLSGFLALFGLQLGYNIVVGLSAAILVKSGAELASDVAFLMFLSIFAPILSTLIAAGGGIALYNGIASNVKQIADVASNLVGAATTIVVKGGS